MPQAGRGATIASHRITRTIVAFGIGIALAVYAFQFVTDSRKTERRAEEETTVHAARDILQRYVGRGGPVEIADPLAPNRALGKAFIYPEGDGFEVSGFYRRGKGDTWHPFLMRLDGQSRLVSLSVRDGDPELAARAAQDPRFEAHAR